MKRVSIFVYGVICYAVFLATFVYAIGFVSGVFVPKAMDSVPAAPFGQALVINICLLGIFAVQHSVMARPAFKRWWTGIIPAPAERSTYVLLSSVALILLFALWEPMGGVVWQVSNQVWRIALHAAAGFGWLLVLASTFFINHFDLFGLRQVWLELRGKSYTPLKFGTPGLYKVVRHPLYLGWLFAFWCTPVMTAAHLVFALATTAYIFVAIVFEERDLTAMHPEYRLYQKRVPMIFPTHRRWRTEDTLEVKASEASA
jgi:protein-S-isoprenylcysteine O-methyltransferase Ste14